MFRFLLGTACVLVLFSCNDGRNHGSSIPIGDAPAPEDAELECRTISVDQCFAVQCGYAEEVADVEGGIFLVVANELFCPEDYLECPVVDIAAYEDAAFNAGYDEGFADGVDSVVCEVGDDQVDECSEDVPPGHLRKECRGHQND